LTPAHPSALPSIEFLHTCSIPCPAAAAAAAAVVLLLDSQVKDDGINISDWLQSLAKFAGAVCRK
jgi:hypothetical protein